MALTLEDGTGVVGAEAYADAAAFDAWALAYWGNSLVGTDTDKEAAIRRAVAYLDALAWIGVRTGGRTQALAWPRTDAIDSEGNELATDEIPAEVIEAQHVLARAELAAPGLLSPDVTLSGKKVLTEVKGIRWEVQKAPNTVDAARPVITAAMDLVDGLLISGGGKTSFLARS